ncbi:DUF1471 domain-containing protein [Klebsiella sp. BIGb0407]|uniref:DUF1471 domain-containing protein n=1 Tax=Klebsiella sp. BIGb0407 TaxID=2940603 RepID=UPI002169F2F8|nr:DUF1471 domain-containing protein [Klebsiella sp. BIGb0407]MCS3431495.1 hypothetical protein [Klebsiella sp. BIGb0407]
MKKLLIPAALSVLMLSNASFAATEIAGSEVNGLAYVGEISTSGRTSLSCTNKLSKIADSKGADYYHVTSVSHQGQDNISFQAKLYK